jgi:thiol:disulfide interchange protein
MQPNVPVPTDNLYKFKALFGLVLLITALFCANAIGDRTSELRIRAAKEAAALPLKPTYRQLQYIEILERGATRSTWVTIGLAVLFGLSGGAGAIASIRGFKQWAKIQPLHDELLRLQVEKARRELAAMAPSESPAAQPSEQLDSPAPETKNPA